MPQLISLLISPLGLTFLADVTILLCFAVGLPLLTLRICKGVDYLKHLEPLKWVLCGVFWTFAFFHSISMVEGLLHYGLQLHVYQKCLGALGLAVFTGVSLLKWPMLNDLHPKEEWLLERKEKQELITKLEVFYDVNPVAVFESRAGVIISANPAAELLTGYTKQELIGMDGRQLLHPKDLHYYHEYVLPGLNTPYECQLLMKPNAAGERRVVEVEVHTSQAPYDRSLRMSFATNNTRYVEDRDYRIRNERGHNAQLSLTQSAQLLINCANQFGTCPEEDSL